MKFLHWEGHLRAGQAVRVELSSQANVQIMDSSNFNNYRAGRRFTYRGGVAKTTPAIVRAPHSGHWHVVVDLGGYAGSVRASFAVC